MIPTGHVFSWHCLTILQPRAEQGQRPEAETIGAQHPGDNDVSPRVEAPIGLQGQRPPETIGNKRLMRFGQADLPRRPRMLDAHQRRCSGPASMAGNRDDIGVCLGHAHRDRPHPWPRNEFHRHPCLWLERLKVEDQLGKILDRVDVVVGWR